jgi:hypothetical protein
MLGSLLTLTKSAGGLFERAYLRKSIVFFYSTSYFYSRSLRTFLLRCDNLYESAILYLTYSSLSLYIRFNKDLICASCICINFFSSLLAFSLTDCSCITCLSFISLMSPYFLSASALSYSFTWNMSLS